MPAPDIFLSYNREDAATAKRFAEAFEAEGFDVWWDAHLRSGEAYDEVTERALQDARAVVVLWSKNSVVSRWVRAEATEAERNKTLVPVMIEPCKRPIMFELVHTAELSHWKGDTSDNAWQAFLGDLRKFIGRPSAAPEGDIAAETAKDERRSSSPKLRRKALILAAIAAAVLALLGSAYFLFGGGLPGHGSSVASNARIPVLVRAFAASGTRDEAETALAGGITDELIVRLRRIPQLRVGTAGADGAGASSAFAGAYFVDGNIRSSGDQLRVTARLTNANGEILWTDTFDRKIGQLFELQELIAGKIADALSVSLDVGADSVAYGGTNNPEAYAAYLQFKATQFGVDQTVPLGYLKRAIALDPNYLKALGALSASFNPRITYASTRREADELLAEMDASTKRMLAANPNIWMGHVSRALYFISAKDFGGAKEEMEFAARLDNQTDPELSAQLAIIDYALGYMKMATSHAQEAEIIDPLYRNDPDMIRHLFYAGNYQAAIDLFNKLPDDTGSGRANHNLEAFWSYMLVGREAEAMAFAERYGRDYGDDARALKSDKALSAMNIDELRNWAVARYGASGQFQLANSAPLASYYGHPELAVSLLKLAFERPGGYAALVLWHPAMAEARKTAAFTRLVTDLGFVKLWRESGDWPDFCQPAAGEGIACH